MAVLQSASAMVVAACLLVTATGAAPQPAPPRLDFVVQEGLNINRFVREGNVAAHLLLRSGTDPRILIAFPAGNSGVGLWFVHRPGRARWTLRAPPAAIHDSDSRGRALYGISADATLEAQDVQVRQAVLSSIRVLRDYQSLGAVPSAVTVAASVHGRTITWSRDRLDGAAGYLLMPALSATAVEAGLSSVLARLSVQGEVAHEEDIGERAVLDHLQSDGSRSAAPVFDYKMIDGNYLLAPVISPWLVHDERARGR